MEPINYTHHLVAGTVGVVVGIIDLAATETVKDKDHANTYNALMASAGLITGLLIKNPALIAAGVSSGLELITRQLTDDPKNNSKMNAGSNAGLALYVATNSPTDPIYTGVAAYLGVKSLYYAWK